MGQQQISYYVTVNKGRPDESIIPKDAPLELSYLMKKCWDEEPSVRPTFESIITYLRKTINKKSWSSSKHD